MGHHELKAANLVSPSAETRAINALRSGKLDHYFPIALTPNSTLLIDLTTEDGLDKIKFKTTRGILLKSSRAAINAITDGILVAMEETDEDHDLTA